MREHFLKNLARGGPEELERYEQLYACSCLPRCRVKLAPSAEPEQLALAM